MSFSIHSVTNPASTPITGFDKSEAKYLLPTSTSFCHLSLACLLEEPFERQCLLSSQGGLAHFYIEQEVLRTFSPSFFRLLLMHYITADVSY
jgi:hypothetical protein